MVPSRAGKRAIGWQYAVRDEEGALSADRWAARGRRDRRAADALVDLLGPGHRGGDRLPLRAAARGRRDDLLRHLGLRPVPAVPARPRGYAALRVAACHADRPRVLDRADRHGDPARPRHLPTPARVLRVRAGLLAGHADGRAHTGLDVGRGSHVLRVPTAVGVSAATGVATPAGVCAGGAGRGVAGVEGGVRVERLGASGGGYAVAAFAARLPGPVRARDGAGDREPESAAGEAAGAAV